MRLSEKNPETKSFIWEGTVLQVGHKAFVERTAHEISQQIRMQGGGVFVSSVQPVDFDLTVYENVNDILINEHPSSQVARKLELPNSQPDRDMNVYTQRDDDGECETLNPEEVSRTLSELEASVGANTALNCSAIQAGEENEERELVQCSSRAATAVSSTPGNVKKQKKRKIVGPSEIEQVQFQKGELESFKAISKAADKMMEAAESIVRCIKELRSDLRTELKPAITSLGIRNYGEIQLSANAIKQLVGQNELFFLEIREKYDLKSSWRTWYLVQMVRINLSVV